MLLAASDEPVVTFWYSSWYFTSLALLGFTIYDGILSLSVIYFRIDTNYVAISQIK